MQSVIGAATKVAQAGAKSLAGTGLPASSGDMLAGLNDFVTEFLATAQSFNMKAVLRLRLTHVHFFQPRGCKCSKGKKCLCTFSLANAWRAKKMDVG
jgi:hypothetical protein